MRVRLVLDGYLVLAEGDLSPNLFSAARSVIRLEVIDEAPPCSLDFPDGESIDLKSPPTRLELHLGDE